MFNSQKELFAHLYETVTDRTCCICWQHTDMKKACCYAHILSKKMYAKLKCVANNIAIVCSEQCHNTVDKLAKWYAYEIHQQIKQWMEASNIINYLKNKSLEK